MISVESVFGGLGIFVGSCLLVFGLFELLKSCQPQGGFFTRHSHIVQLLLSILFIIGLIFSTYVGFGLQMAGSLLSGIGLALGFALQPIMKKVVSGIVFDSTRLTGKIIEIGKMRGTVTSVGLVHTWIKEEGTDNKICLHNDFIDRTPFKLIPTGVSNPPGPDTEMNLKLW